ncbi:MAG: hypothetical protein RL446_751, partial [Pseudomonadota bacterium]
MQKTQKNRRHFLATTALAAGLG